MKLGFLLWGLLAFFVAAIDSQANFYKLGQQLNYRDAKRKCEERNGQLPEPKTQALHNELKALQTRLRREAGYQKFDVVWMGMKHTSDKNFQWESGSRVTSYIPWKKYGSSRTPDEPNYMTRSSNAERNVVNDKDGYWRTRTEGSRYDVICQTKVSAATQPAVQPTASCSGDGFFALGVKGDCVKVVRESRTWSSALNYCFRHGAKLFTPSMLEPALVALSKLSGGSSCKGHSFWFGGSSSVYTLTATTPLTSALKQEKTMMVSAARGCGMDFKTFVRRWYGVNSDTNLAEDNGKCLEMNFQQTSPRVLNVGCDQRRQFICHQAAKWDPTEVSETGWFNTKAGSRSYDKESFSIYKQYKGSQAKLRQCVRPVACQCRLATRRDRVMDSRLPTNPNNAPFVRGKACQLVGNDCVLECKKGTSSRDCGNYEMNVICPKTDANNCNLVSNRKECEKQNRMCRDGGEEGFRCVERPSSGGFGDRSCKRKSDGRKIYMQTCSATGDPHYRSFDGKKYSYQGTCCYVLSENKVEVAGVPMFKVVVCHDKLNRPQGKVSWAKSVKVTLGGHVFAFDRSTNFMVDNQKFPCTGYRTEEGILVSCRKCNGKVRFTLTTPECIVLTWDGRHSVHFSLPPAYAGKVAGLCGDMDGSPDNDITGSIHEFAQSYLADTTAKATCNAGDLGGQPCDKNKYNIDSFCGLLHYNSANFLYPSLKSSWRARKCLLDKWNDCRTDLCEESTQTPEWQRQEIICPAFTDIEEDILKKSGLASPVDWRAIVGCNEDCSKEPNTVFSKVQPSCERTCLHETGEEAGCSAETLAVTKPGCVCATGYVRNGIDNICVPKADCSKQCYNVKKDPNNADSATLTLKKGQTMVLQPCKHKVACINGVATTVPVAVCGAHATCSDNKCVCLTGYKGNGITCTKESKGCLPGWSEFGRKCYKVNPIPGPWQDAARACCADDSRLARVDNREDSESLAAFINTATGNDFWESGNTNIIGADKLVGALPTSYDKSLYVSLTDELTNLGCYYVQRDGNHKIDNNCNTPRAAICEYANPHREQPAGPKPPTSNFYNLGRKLNYAAAKKACEDRKDQLPKPTTQTLQSELSKLQQSIGNLGVVWLDMKYSTTTKSFSLESAYRHWKKYGSRTTPDEPNYMTRSTNAERNVVNDEQGFWRTRNGGSTYSVICQRKGSQQKVYREAKFLVASREKTTFLEARQLCKSKGRSLPVFPSKAALLEFQEFMPSNMNDVWCGLELVNGQWTLDGGARHVLTEDWYPWGSPKEPNYPDVEKAGRVAWASKGTRNSRALKFRSSPGLKKWGMVICGPRIVDLPYVWSPYVYRNIPVKTSVEEILRQEGNRANGVRFPCRYPMAVDCEVKDAASRYVSAQGVNSATQCSKAGVQCVGPACASFRVRFFCPAEENICQRLQELKGSNPCPGGQMCIPEVNGCFTCQCAPGYAMSHEGKCIKRCGHCTLRGDPHFTANNGVRYDFQGTCKYLFSGICPGAVVPKGVLRYSVEASFKKCGKVSRKVSCLKTFTVLLQDVPESDTVKNSYNITMSVGQSYYLLNGARKTELFTATKTGANPGRQFSVGLNSKVFVLEGLGGLMIESQKSILKISPPAALRDEMCGLCGQCDEQFKFRNGTRKVLNPNGGKIGSALAIEFANSWLVNDPANTAEACAVSPTPGCADAAEQQKAEALCGAMLDTNGDFVTCHDQISPTTAYEDCVTDYCMEGESAACEIMMGYANLCAGKSLALSWRKADRCAMTCPADREYATNVNCQPKCGAVTSACTTADSAEGCVCKDNKYDMNNMCVASTECSCQYVSSTGVDTIMPGQKVLAGGCTEYKECQAGGTVATTVYTKDPNAVCKPGSPDTVECVQGYTLQADGKTCQRDPKTCRASFTTVDNNCWLVPEKAYRWRRAVAKCNMENAVLVKISTAQKLSELSKFMKANNLDRVLVSGQLKQDARNEWVPRFSGAGVPSQLQNFAVYVPPGTILKADVSGESNYALAAVRDTTTDAITFEAVSRSDPIRPLCEERDETTETYEQSTFCSKDMPSSDNKEIETVSVIIEDAACKMCPVPAGVTCRNVEDASTPLTGTCGYNNGVLYTCEGAGCADAEVSASCPKDIDECTTGFHDCNTDQICVNTIGAYLCKCSEAKPLLINDQCTGTETCTISQPLTASPYDLRLAPFSSTNPGNLNYAACVMKFFESCSSIVNPPVLPKLDITLQNNMVAGVLKQVVLVKVGTPDLTGFRSQEFSVATAGTVTPLTGLNVDQLPSGMNGFILTEKNELFKVTIENNNDGSLKKLEVTVSDLYRKNYKTCGLCELPRMDQITFTDVTIGQGCAPVVPPPVPGSNSPLGQTTPTPATTLATPPAPPAPPLPPAQPTTTTTTTTPAKPPAQTTPTITTTTTTTDSPQTPALPNPPPPPPPPPPAPPTTTTPQPAQTTPPPTAPEPDECANETQACRALQALCAGVDVAECRRQTCEDKLPLCDYIGNATFQNCSQTSRNDFVIYVKNTLTCQKEKCGANEAMLFLAAGRSPPTCAKPDVDPPTEDAVTKFSFQCTCNREANYVLEQSKCVQMSDCGCAATSEGYKKVGETWKAADCSKTYRCDKGGKVTETVVTCDETAVCEKGECMCTGDDKGKGVPNMPNGCKGVDKGNQTCYLSGTENEACSCRKGFAPTCDGCQDIDECALLTGLCSARENCKNTLGGYTCECRSGYKREGADCKDINECLTKNDACTRAGKGSYCINFIGKYSCQCCAGYDLDSTGVCKRNYQRVPLMSEASASCCTCPGTEPLCKTNGPGCFRTAQSLYRQYDNFRFLYEDQCLQRRPEEALNSSNWTPGPCPQSVTLAPPSEATTTTTTAATTTPATINTTKKRRECTAANTCNNAPVPPELKNTAVCGPTGSNEKTYPTICDMLLAMCGEAGGPDNFKSDPLPDVKKGSCLTTTSTTTTTTTTIAPAPWSEWSDCVLPPGSECGLGQRTQTRKNGPFTETRQMGCSLPCSTSSPANATTTTASPASPTTPTCPGLDDCPATGKVCGQIGAGGSPTTFNSFCTLEAYACRSNLKPYKLYNGQCKEDDTEPRKFCEDPVVAKLSVVKRSGRPDCTVAVLDADCTSRLCKDGGADTCCVMDSAVKLDIEFTCQGGETIPAQLEKPLSCKCAKREKP